ncbi:MAG: hypothetical protein O9247_01820 [Rhodobacteraceae bacterium]|nr:hypothetical protein [Paracoccaceae bacterium]
MPRLPLLALLACLLLPGPALAQVVRVISGDHPTFTRLVLSFDRAPDWQLGRSPDGYALRLSGAQPRYDLSDIFRRITRDRVAAVWADPGDGMLRLRVACACHALPFELRPGVIVIDIRDGPPPPGSSFEAALDGGALPPLADAPRPRPRARADMGPIPFDWTAQITPSNSNPPLPPPPLPALAEAALREELLQSLSRGMAEGLIDPVSRLPTPDASPSPQRMPEPGNLRFGDPLDTRTGLSPPQQVAADGQACPDDSRLDLAAWGDTQPAATQLSNSLSGLLGEFDRPDPAAVQQAVRLHLHLGFGAEARALLQAFPIDGPDIRFLASLGRIVDGEADPDGPFRGMAGCDGAAALWALLADPALPPRLSRAPAVLRNFSVLPAPLRRHLGPGLAERFLAAGDAATAAALQDSFLRIPGPPDPRATVTEARITAALGAAPQAAELLQAPAAEPGPAQPLALVALVDLHAADGRALDPSVESALAAFLPQFSGTEDEAALRRAHVLALALTDQFDAAFAALPGSRAAAPDLWRLLAQGPDDAVLLHAIGADPAAVPPSQRDSIAQRLLDLGFPEEARRWAGTLGPLALPPPDPDPLQRAIRSRNWADLPSSAPEAWQSAAAQLSATPATTDPPLARSQALATSSEDTRAAILGLLDAIPPP